jgi:AcrR family transcriptional regulator
MGRPPRIARQQLLDVARAVFSKKGFGATTLADIAAELNVTPAAILRHVESKQALFDEAMRGGDLVELPPAVAQLATVDATTDPRIVLRQLAEGIVPFVQSILATRIVVAMHESSQRTSVTLPFNADTENNPPRRAFAMIADYMRRATEAGRLHVRDPRAATLLFMGSLQGYVLFHYVLKVTPAYPLSDYIDALVELWSEGAISNTNRGGSRGRS